MNRPHLNKEKFAKGGIGMIREKRKSFAGKKDMISALDLETRARPFDDARVEAQTALRQQPITPTEVLDQAGREVGVAGDGQTSRQEQAIGDHFDGVGKTDAIGVNVGLLGGFAHQDTQGIMRQEQGVEFLQDADGALAGQGTLSNALMLFDLIDHQFDFPALVVEQTQVQSRIKQRVQQGGHQAMDCMHLGIGRPTAMLTVRRCDLLQARGGLRAQAVADDAHSQGLGKLLVVLAGQGHQHTAITQDAGGTPSDDGR